MGPCHERETLRREGRGRKRGHRVWNHKGECSLIPCAVVDEPSPEERMGDAVPTFYFLHLRELSLTESLGFGAGGTIPQLPAKLTHQLLGFSIGHSPQAHHQPPGPGMQEGSSQAEHAFSPDNGTGARFARRKDNQLNSFQLKTGDFRGGEPPAVTIFGKSTPPRNVRPSKDKPGEVERVASGWWSRENPITTSFHSRGLPSRRITTQEETMGSQV